MTDITEHLTGENTLHCCVVKDVFARRIVGYAIDSHRRAELAVRALNNAVAICGGVGEVAGCVVHSDRGGQFHSGEFLAALQAHRMVGLMGTVASCCDNASMGSFFSLLQENVLDRWVWTPWVAAGGDCVLD